MADFTPEEFEEEKYVDYFPQLQTAYKKAFNRLNEEYSSDLVHAIDQQILNESEPHYEGDGEFRIELPENPTDRLQGVVADDEKVEQLLDIYVDELEDQLRAEFGFDDQPKA
ncbi:DUF5783 family protein [Halospeciosus flavus]|uniref:DUF5783 family protein n=1 Tax=Halospeciosus flavus TaxID=3032283 RepID=A0ABD5Z7H5_9EURY|nr:DUF5783 family protein [Halospeciosus flavus]